MPPKKKKNAPKNAFYFYMLDFRARKESEGFKFPGGLKDVADLASKPWQGLDPKTKRHYENMAERAKACGLNDVRYNTQGQTFEEADAKKFEMDKKFNTMLDDIRLDVVSAGYEGLKRKRFYFIHVNHFGMMENQHYIPCEVAVLAYTIEKGYEPQNVIHRFIKNLELPSGYSYKALAHSEATHRCQVPPKSLGTCLVDEIREDIYSLIDKNGDIVNGVPPPLYTLDVMMPECIDFFTFMYDGVFSSLDEIDDTSTVFRVYSLEQLFFYLKNTSLKPPGQRLIIDGVKDEGFPHLAVAEKILKNDIFAYAPNICCDYHEDQDARQHCSRSYVIRWSYLLSDNVCANVDVPMKHLSHAPKSTDLTARKITSEMETMTINDPPREAAPGRGIPINTGAIPKTYLSQAVGKSSKFAIRPDTEPRALQVNQPPFATGDHFRGRLQERSIGRGIPLKAGVDPMPYQPLHQNGSNMPTETIVRPFSSIAFGRGEGASGRHVIKHEHLTASEPGQFSDSQESSDEEVPAAAPHSFLDEIPLRQPRTVAKSSLMLSSALSSANAPSSSQPTRALGVLGRGRAEVMKNLLTKSN